MEENMKHDTLNAAQTIALKKDFSRCIVWKVLFAVMLLVVVALCGALGYTYSELKRKYDRRTSAETDQETKSRTDEDRGRRAEHASRFRDPSRNHAEMLNEDDRSEKRSVLGNLFSSEDEERLKDSNEQLRNCIVKLTSYIEAEDAPYTDMLEAKKDVSPREAREVDDPEMENLLEDYHSEFEMTDLKRMNWGNPQFAQLCRPYDTDAEGKKQINTNKSGAGRRVYIQEGAGTAQELIDAIIDRATKQYDKLRRTRQELVVLRMALQKLADEYNELTKEIRLNKIEIEKRWKEIEKLTEEKKAVEDDLQKAKAEVEEQKTEIKSLQEEVRTAKDETIAAKEALDKAKETIDNMKALLQKRSAAPRAQVAGPVTGGGQLTRGDKGTIQNVNNEKLYAVIKFDDAALDELIDSDRTGALPPHEMLVVRPAQGENGKTKFIGKVRLRQWMPKTNLVTADILADWQQEPVKVNDVVRPD